MYTSVLQNLIWNVSAVLSSTRKDVRGGGGGGGARGKYQMAKGRTNRVERERERKRSNSKFFLSI